MSIISLHLLWLVFVNLLLTTSNTEREYFPTKNYDSEFIPFMKKMYSEMPGPAKIEQEKKGPNAGYMPYWYAYNFQLHGMPKQKNPYWGVDKGAGGTGGGGWGASSHEDWDYGLGMGSGKGLWGQGNLSLTAANRYDKLGAAELLDQDLKQSEERVCFANQGPSCDMGRAAWEYSWDELKAIQTKTDLCDQCLPKYQKVGLVCTVDRKSITQEMDFCVMLKMNCLAGTAYRADDKWRYGSKSSKVPFAMKQQWIRFAARGRKDAELKMFAMYPYKTAIYWVIVAGWPWTGPKSAVFPDSEEPYDGPTLAFRKDRYWGWAVTEKNFTEYTITWNTKTGWFLLSQGRQKDWQKLLNLEFVDPYPRTNIRYFDVASGWSGLWMEYLLSGLRKLYDGPCVFIAEKKDLLPSGTQEMLKEVRLVQKQYDGRMEKLKALGEHLSELSGQEGSYIDYQYDQKDQNGQNEYANNNAFGQNSSHNKNKYAV